jgi:hypothetical protein
MWPGLASGDEGDVARRAASGRSVVQFRGNHDKHTFMPAAGVIRRSRCRMTFSVE